MSEVENKVAELEARLQEQKETLDQIHQDLKSVREIIEAWNNVKGFATTMKFIASAIKITVTVGGAVGFFWFLTKYGQPPK